MTKQESEKLEILKKSFSDSTMTHWVKNFGVRCHIFAIQIDSETQLKKDWESITNRIAIDFQADFEDEYESWNVYEVFLTKSEISKDLKYKIGNDKYSSRKIVMDKISPAISEDEIKERISKRIFQLDLDIEEIAEKPKKDLSKILDPKLFKLIYGKELDGLTKDGKKEREKRFEELLEGYFHEIKKD